MALVEPETMLCQYENDGNFTARLALLEEMKSLPFGAVWDAYCQRQDVPVGFSYMDDISDYEAQVLSKRA